MTKQISLFGRRAFLSDKDIMVAKGAHGAGDADSPPIVIPGAKDIVALWDDFVADTGAIGAWNRLDGDTGGKSTAALVAGTNGLLRFTTTADNDPQPANV